jgi:hypothetical protein
MDFDIRGRIEEEERIRWRVRNELDTRERERLAEAEHQAERKAHFSHMKFVREIAEYEEQRDALKQIIWMKKSEPFRNAKAFWLRLKRRIR